MELIKEESDAETCGEETEDQRGLHHCWLFINIKINNTNLGQPINILQISIILAIIIIFVIIRAVKPLKCVM